MGDDLTSDNVDQAISSLLARGVNIASRFDEMNCNNSDSDAMSTRCALRMPSMPTSNSMITDKQEKENYYSLIGNRYFSSTTSANNSSMPVQLLLADQEAAASSNTDKLLLPRSLKRRTSLLEKSRDWARRFIALGRSRRSTTSVEKFHSASDDSQQSDEKRRRRRSKHSSQTLVTNEQKSFDEDGYLSPLEIKAQLESVARPEQPRSSSTKFSSSYASTSSTSNVARCHPTHLQRSISQCTCQQQKRAATTSFPSEFHQSLSVVDYIDFDGPDESPSMSPIEESDDPLHSLKYLFIHDESQAHGHTARRIPRRATNASSISADSGYCEASISTAKCIPVHLISCTLVPVNMIQSDLMEIPSRLTCTCPSSSTCLSRQTPSQSPMFRPLRTQKEMISNRSHSSCLYHPKYYSTMTICPSSAVDSQSVTKMNHLREVNDYQPSTRQSVRPQASPSRLPTVVDEFTSIARWFKPDLPRDAISDALQQADYGAFVLRHSSTHPDCYALSIKVPKFTHDSNIVHYLIEKTTQNDLCTYRIKGTTKRFPTLLSLLTHHSVMPEILPITLNLYESSSL